MLVQPNRQGFDWDAVRRLPEVAAVATYLISDIRFEGPARRVARSRPGEMLRGE